MPAELNALEVGARVFGVADKYALGVGEVLSDPSRLENIGDVLQTSLNISMMTSMWQLAASMTKEISEPLKSIVNK
jgi:hypothetical protein